MDDSNIILFQVSSGDYGASGTASQFSNTLAYPIILDKTKEYEVCVYDIQYSDLQRFDAPNPPYLSVYVNTNLINGNTIIGSQTTNAIMWISWTHIYTDSVFNGYNDTIYLTTEKNRKWYPLANPQISNVKVSLTLSTGALIKSDANCFTSITFAVREKKY